MMEYPVRMYVVKCTVVISGWQAVTPHILAYPTNGDLWHGHHGKSSLFSEQLFGFMYYFIGKVLIKHFHKVTQMFCV